MATAATPTCLGKKATIVSSKSSITGTSKADVIVSRATGAINIINGKGGADLICGGRATDFILGGPGKDKLKGGGGGDFLSGGGGNDHLYGDTKDGGQIDLAYYLGSRTGVNANLATGMATGEGEDMLHNLDGLYGTNFDDTLTGDDNTNFIWGQGGNDTISGGGGLDLITPGDGDDAVDGGAGDPASDGDILYVNDATGPTSVDLLTGTSTGEGIGTDTLTDFENVVGSNFADDISGDNASNFLFGGAGNDVMDGKGGFDYAAYWFALGAVTANLESGQATGASAPDETGFDLGEGTDTLRGLEGLLGTMEFADTLIGDNKGNYLDGDGGADVISAGGGDDWIVGGLGNDRVDGGTGDFDFWDYYGSESVNANLVQGQITTSSLNITITGIEAVAGADSADTFVGDGADNRFFGWSGNDTFTGGGGDDWLDGGAGDADSADPGAGADTCAFIETGTCEVTWEESLPKHPLQEEAATVTNLRRNF